MDNQMTRNRRDGFTLVELLVVVAVIGMLLAILLPAVQSVRGAARQTGCQNNLRQVGLAITNYESANDHFPPGQQWVSRKEPDNFSYSWAAQILSYIEEQQLADQIDFKKPFLYGPNRNVASQAIPIYLCPATSLREEHRNAEEKLINTEGGFGDGLACIDYLGIAGPSRTWKNPATGIDYGPQRGVLIGTKGLENELRILKPPVIRAQRITDGLSKTSCVTECSGRGLEDDGDFHGAWVSGKNIGHLSKGVNTSKTPKAWYNERVYSQHGSGVHFLFCDGSLRFLPTGTDKEIIKAITSRDGEEVSGDIF